MNPMISQTLLGTKVNASTNSELYQVISVPTNVSSTGQKTKILMILTYTMVWKYEIWTFFQKNQNGIKILTRESYLFRIFFLEWKLYQHH